MSGHDSSSEELLSAYVDGELSADEDRELERLLSTSVEYRRLLGELCALNAILGTLPRHPLDARCSRWIQAAVSGVASERVAFTGGSPNSPTTDFLRHA